MLKLPGRVGDTPVIGSGSYCGPAGAITCTGHGEAVMRVVLSKYCYDLLEAGRSAEQAANSALAHLLERVNGHAGLIVLDAQGRRAWATSTRNIAVGLPGVTREVAGGSGTA
jgi:beta-aspartyl-peptidase (threonine type)